MDQLLDIIRHIPGLMTPEELTALYEIARGPHVPVRGEIVELGVYNGKSLAVLCAAAGPWRVSGVDNWGMQHHGSSYRKLTEGYLRGVGFSPVLHTGDTRNNYGIESVALLHVDSHHHPDTLQQEINAWRPAFIAPGKNELGEELPGTVVALHDYGRTQAYPGYTEKIDELFLEDAKWDLLTQAGTTIAFHWKRNHA